jgi:putative urate catabolism protein
MPAAFRDLVGFGSAPPNAEWPNGARLAVQFVINYEEGGETSILHGDAASEFLLTDAVMAKPLPGERSGPIESLFEYGSRTGFWRLHRLFTGRGVPLTIFGVAMAMERNPDAVAAMIEAGWEIASHGYRWIDHRFMPAEVEREHLRKAIAIHTATTGTPPAGIYVRDTSVNTRRLVAEAGTFLYDSNSFSDDLPYWSTEYGRPILVVPYALDTNDLRFVSNPGLGAPDDFFEYLRDAFDVLRAEGATRPAMMSIGLHCRIVARPSRIGALERFLDHVLRFDDVWVCRRVDIARHWIARHPCLG